MTALERTASLRRTVRFDKFEGQAILEHLQQAADADHEIEHETSLLHGSNSWQVKALKVLHSPTVELTLGGLLVFDIFVLFYDLYMEADHPDCYAVVHNAVCEGESEVSCVEHEEPPIAGVVDALSLAITCVFMAENTALLLILGFQQFFSNFFYAFDFFVVGTSLGLEIAFLILEEDKLATLSGLLVLARLWRFVKLGHGLFTTALKAEEKTIHSLEERIKKLEDLLSENGVKIPEQVKNVEASQDTDYHVLT